MNFEFVYEDKLEKEFFIKAQSENSLVLVGCAITVEETKKMDTTRIKRMLQKLARIGAPARASLMWTFDGYDEEPVTLAEVPLVVDYVKKVVDEHPEVIYYCNPELNSYIFTCICNCTMYTSPALPKPPYTPPRFPNDTRIIQMDLPEINTLINSLEASVVKHGTKIGDKFGAQQCMKEWRQLMNL